MTPAHLFHVPLTPFRLQFAVCQNPKKPLKTHLSETRKSTPSAGSITPRFGGSGRPRFDTLPLENMSRDEVLAAARKIHIEE